ncbi:MAG: HEAT repeat domain-containing protein [Planctomycetaceae bacterium]|nr:HEAT repeat domain-containing protein [Planctomycetaceae bacterium]
MTRLIETDNSSSTIRHRNQLGTRMVRCLMLMGLMALGGCGPTRLEGLLEAAQSSNNDERRTALRSIADLGAEAQPAVPVLRKLSEDLHPDVRRLCGLALGNIATALPDDQELRENVVEILNRQLSDSELAVRNTAAFALLQIDANHTKAQQTLQRAIRQGDGGVVDRLTHLQPRPLWSVPTLIEILGRDERPGLRRLAAVALGEIAPTQEAARAALQAGLRDRDDEVRSAAQEALHKTPG